MCEVAKEGKVLRWDGGGWGELYSKERKKSAQAIIGDLEQKQDIDRIKAE